MVFVSRGEARLVFTTGVRIRTLRSSPRDLLWRLETMAMMSDVDLPAAHIRNQVAAAIDLWCTSPGTSCGGWPPWREPVAANQW